MDEQKNAPAKGLQEQGETPGEKFKRLLAEIIREETKWMTEEQKQAQTDALVEMISRQATQGRARRSAGRQPGQKP